MDKELYRANRTNGQRGQGAYSSTVLMADITPATGLRGLGRLKNSKHQMALTVKADLKKRRIGKYATARDIQARALILRQRALENKAAVANGLR